MNILLFEIKVIIIPGRKGGKQGKREKATTRGKQKQRSIKLILDQIIGKRKNKGEKKKRIKNNEINFGN